MTGWRLPRAVELGGREYAINTDYRDILDIIARLQDENEDQQTRLYVALALFYEGFPAMPPALWQQAAEQMMEFIGCGQPAADGPPPPQRIDWEQDQSMIVAEVNKVAGCEVRSLPYLHWWTFVGYFSCIGEGQLATVVSIRDKLRRGKKLEKWEQDFYRENRDLVRLKPRYTAEELAEQQRLKQLLGE